MKCVRSILCLAMFHDMVLFDTFWMNVQVVDVVIREGAPPLQLGFNKSGMNRIIFSFQLCPGQYWKYWSFFCRFVFFRWSSSCCSRLLCSIWSWWRSYTTSDTIFDTISGSSGEISETGTRKAETTNSFTSNPMLESWGLYHVFQTHFGTFTREIERDFTSIQWWFEGDLDCSLY